MQIQTRDRILDLHLQLKNAKSLSPSARINKLFTELVDICTDSSDKTAQFVLTDPSIEQILPSLRALCSSGEGMLESYWAQRILESKHPSITLEQFPYYENYLKLTELEYRSLTLSGARPLKRILFVGSGPLPLSSILLTRHYGVQVDNIDCNAEAVGLSTKLVHHLGLGDALRIETADALTYKNYDQYDAIFLAALVGIEQQQKQAVLTAIQRNMRPGSLLVVRTAHNLRALLYPQVSLDDIHGFEPQVVIQPLNEVVNSVIVLQKSHDCVPGDLVISDKTDCATADSFRRFCTAMIAETYHYSFNPAWHFDIERAEEIYGRDRSNMFVARYRGEIVGVIAIRPYDSDYAMFAGRYGIETASVWRFFVDPRYKHLNLERLLEQRIEAFAKASHFSQLYAHDQRDVPGALQKYIQNGYAVTYESNDSFGTVHFEKNLGKTHE